MVKEGQGIYRKVQLTVEESKLTFPFEPLYYFYNYPMLMTLLLKKFIWFNNTLALNITNLDSFKAIDLKESKIFNVGVYATFNDGSATYVIRDTRKKFEKQGGIQSYTDLLKKHKKDEQKNYTYKTDDIYYTCYPSITHEFIENYSVGENMFVIPKLQEEQPNVKKLTPIIKD